MVGPQDTYEAGPNGNEVLGPNLGTNILTTNHMNLHWSGITGNLAQRVGDLVVEGQSPMMAKASFMGVNWNLEPNATPRKPAFCAWDKAEQWPLGENDLGENWIQTTDDAAQTNWKDGHQVKTTLQAEADWYCPLF